MKVAAGVLIALGGLVLLAPGASAQDSGAPGSSVLYTQLDDEAITPVIERFLLDGVARAVAEGHEALVIEIDTPGGLDTSTRDIVRGFLEARAPVIVFVPQGGRAASAGAFIGFSAHVLAMAPGTSIGAATPIAGEGGQDLDRKIVNEAASFIESVARARDRNVAFARATVTDGRAASAEEALELNAIDLIARDVESLLGSVHGRRVELDSGPVTLNTQGATLVAYDLSLLQRIRQRLADPNLAFLFISIGTLALIYELANPGIAGAGTVGVILLLLGLFGISVLPVNTVGALLLLLAMALFISEVFTPGVGVFAAGGVVALVLGGLFLFEGAVEVSKSVLLPVAAAVGGGTAVAGRIAMRARLKPSIVGADALIGQSAVIKRGGQAPQIFVEGAWWRVRARDPVDTGTPVRIVGVDGLDLIVETQEEQ